MLQSNALWHIIPKLIILWAWPCTPKSHLFSLESNRGLYVDDIKITKHYIITMILYKIYTLHTLYLPCALCKPYNSFPKSSALRLKLALSAWEDRKVHEYQTISNESIKIQIFTWGSCERGSTLLQPGGKGSGWCETCKVMKLFMIFN